MSAEYESDKIFSTDKVTYSSEAYRSGNARYKTDGLFFEYNADGLASVMIRSNGIEYRQTFEQFKHNSNMSNALSPESEPSYMTISASDYARLVNAERKLKYAIERLEDSIADPIIVGEIKLISADATQLLVNHIKS